MNSKDLFIKVIFYTKRRYITEEYFPKNITLYDIKQYYKEKISDGTTIFFKNYYINTIKLNEQDKISKLISHSSNILKISIAIELREVEELKYQFSLIRFDDENEEIYSQIIKPKLNPFGLIVFLTNNSTIKIEQYPSDILKKYNLDKFNSNYAYCNSPNYLFLSGENNFWIINKKTYSIKYLKLKLSKNNHSMIYVPNFGVFMVGGDSNKTYYYDIINNKFKIWGNTMNNNITRPALIYHDEYLYCFQCLNEKNKFFEKTFLGENTQKKWEIIYPRFKGISLIEFYNNDFAVSKSTEGKILFIGGNNKNSFIFNHLSDTIIKTEGENEKILFGEKIFYKLNKVINISIPSDFEKSKELAIVNKYQFSLQKIKYKNAQKDLSINNELNFENNFNIINDNQIGNFSLQEKFIGINNDYHKEKFAVIRTYGLPVFNQINYIKFSQQFPKCTCPFNHNNASQTNLLKNNKEIKQEKILKRNRSQLTKQKNNEIEINVNNKKKINENKNKNIINIIHRQDPINFEQVIKSNINKNENQIINNNINIHIQKEEKEKKEEEKTEKEEELKEEKIEKEDNKIENDEELKEEKTEKEIEKEEEKIEKDEESKEEKKEMEKEEDNEEKYEELKEEQKEEDIKEVREEKEKEEKEIELEIKEEIKEEKKEENEVENEEKEIEKEINSEKEDNINKEIIEEKNEQIIEIKKEESINEENNISKSQNKEINNNIEKEENTEKKIETIEGNKYQNKNDESVKITTNKKPDETYDLYSHIKEIRENPNYDIDESKLHKDFEKSIITNFQLKESIQRNIISTKINVNSDEKNPENLENKKIIENSDEKNSNLENIEIKDYSEKNNIQDEENNNKEKSDNETEPRGKIINNYEIEETAKIKKQIEEVQNSALEKLDQFQYSESRVEQPKSENKNISFKNEAEQQYNIEQEINEQKVHEDMEPFQLKNINENMNINMKKGENKNENFQYKENLEDFMAQNIEEDNDDENDVVDDENVKINEQVEKNNNLEEEDENIINQNYEDLNSEPNNEINKDENEKEINIEQKDIKTNSDFDINYNQEESKEDGIENENNADNFTEEINLNYSNKNNQNNIDSNNKKSSMEEYVSNIDNINYEENGNIEIEYQKVNNKKEEEEYQEMNNEEDENNYEEDEFQEENDGEEYNYVENEEEQMEENYEEQNLEEVEEDIDDDNNEMSYEIENNEGKEKERDSIIHISDDNFNKEEIIKKEKEKDLQKYQKFVKNVEYNDDEYNNSEEEK